jgi:hypothetical protein
VGDLKQAIVEQKKLAKSIENFDLQITNAQTSEGAPPQTHLVIILYFIFKTRVPFIQ